MSLTARVITASERLPLPDAVLRFGVAQLVRRTSSQLSKTADSDMAFARSMDHFPIAIHTGAANQQHYELPPEFFAKVLGPRQKYSSCLYRETASTLVDAELAALHETCDHAALRDGQTILELGCGWGSLSLHMAERFPRSRILAVSNSKTQQQHIEAASIRRGLSNLEIITADMNSFDANARFDRIVSVEMFEHISNWRALLERAHSWMKADGRLFIHVFSHRTIPYRFDHRDEADWIARHFFTGGLMPSHGLMRQFSGIFTVEQDWRWSGLHYQRTALDWLRNFDENTEAVKSIFDRIYGSDCALWMRRWRLFFMATAGLFGHANGTESGVSHYLLRPER